MFSCCSRKQLPEGFEEATNKITPGLNCDKNNRIVGGSVADKNTWPWLVMLSVITSDGYEGLCGGTILSDTRILTAAHCFETVNDEVIVNVGNWKTSNVNEEGEFSVTAQRVIIHPNYNPADPNSGESYDFAMLEVPSLDEVKL